MANQTPADLELAGGELAGLFQELQNWGEACDALALVPELQIWEDAREALRARHMHNPAMLAHVQCMDRMLEQKGAVNAVGLQSGLTPLIVACLNGDAANAGRLLALGADPSAECYVYDSSPIGAVENSNSDENRCKEFALTIAIRDGHEAIAEMLLAYKGVNVNQASSDFGGSAFYVSCMVGNMHICKLLFAHNGGVDVNTATTDVGWTPLLIACDQAHTEIVTLLLARDEIAANQASTDVGTTPLYNACYNGHAEIVAALLKCDKVDVNKPSSDGTTPLLIACDQGHAEVARLLLRHGGIEVDKAMAIGGTTALHIAAYYGRLSVAQLLVVYGASLTATDGRQGRAAAEIAAYKGHSEVAAWLGAVSGWSPLRVAAGCRLHRDAALLLRHGRVDPDNSATTSSKDIMRVVVAASTVLPWQNAPPICTATVKLVADAFSGLHRHTFWLHHAGARKAVFATLVVAARLDTEDSLRWAEAAGAGAGAGCNPTTAPTKVVLPILPPEIWLYALRFVKRSWWAIERARAALSTGAGRTGGRVTPPI